MGYKVNIFLHGAKDKITQIKKPAFLEREAGLKGSYQVFF